MRVGKKLVPPATPSVQGHRRMIAHSPAPMALAHGKTLPPPPYTQSFAVVHRLRDGLIVEADYYLDRDQALQAAGVSE